MVFQATELDSCGQGTERHQLSPFSCAGGPMRHCLSCFLCLQTGSSEVEGSAGTWDCFPDGAYLHRVELGLGLPGRTSLPRPTSEKAHSSVLLLLGVHVWSSSQNPFFLFLSSNKEFVVFRVCGLPRVYRWGTLPSMVNHSKMMSCFFQMKGRVLRLNWLNCEQNQKSQVYCSLKGGETRCWKG